MALNILVLKDINNMGWFPLRPPHPGTPGGVAGGVADQVAGGGAQLPQELAWLGQLSQYHPIRSLKLSDLATANTVNMYFSSHAVTVL